MCSRQVAGGGSHDVEPPKGSDKHYFGLEFQAFRVIRPRRRGVTTVLAGYFAT